MDDRHSGATLEERLSAVEDRLALLDLEGRYGATYDSRDGEAWAGLFTEDGVYQSRDLEGLAPGNLVRGRANLARFCHEHAGTGTHTVHTPRLSIEGDQATGRVHFQFDGSRTDEHGWIHYRHANGYYDVAYLRTAEGWRMRRRITTLVDLVTRTTFGYEPSAADLERPPAERPGEEGYRDRRI